MSTTQMSHVYDKIRNEIRKDKIELWKEPYYIDGESQEILLEVSSKIIVSKRNPFLLTLFFSLFST